MNHIPFNPEDYDNNTPLLWWEKILGIIIALIILYIPFFAPKLLPEGIWQVIRDVAIGFILGIIYSAYRFAFHKHKKENKKTL